MIIPNDPQETLPTLVHTPPAVIYFSYLRRLPAVLRTPPASRIMLFDWLNTKAIDEFAKALARDFARRYPPSMESEHNRAATKKLAAAIDEIYARADKFKQRYKLGVYKKAKLGNVFKWELKELGYSEAFIDQVTDGLVLSLARKGNPSWPTRSSSR